MENSATLEGIRVLILPVLDDEGVELVDVIYRREGRRVVLRLLVDTPSGITIDECTQLNKKIGDELDGSDLDLQNYILEVSSPGLDRPLIKKRDFERLFGKELKVITKVPVAGKDNVYIGCLNFVGDEDITLKIENGEDIVIPYDEIARARQHIKF